MTGIAAGIAPGVAGGIAPGLGVPVSGVEPFYGLSFDGGDYVEVPKITAIDGATALTVAAWVFHENAASPIHEEIVTCFDNSSTPTERQYRLFVFDLTHRFLYGTVVLNTGLKQTSHNVNFPVNEWVHVAMTWSTGTGKLRLYQNGVMVKEANAAGANIATVAADAVTRIGCMGEDPTPAFFFTGKITAVVLEDSVLDISALMLDTAPASVIARWPMQPGSGSSCEDKSGNGHDGTLPAAPSTPTWIGPYIILTASGPA